MARDSIAGKTNGFIAAWRDAGGFAECWEPTWQIGRMTVWENGRKARGRREWTVGLIAASWQYDGMTKWQGIKFARMAMT